MSLWGQFAVGDLDQALNEAWLMAEGMRLVSANGPESGPAAVSIGELSPVHRALLDLSLIDDVPIDVVARIASIPSAEVGDALVDAQRLFARGFAGVPLDDFCAPTRSGSTTTCVECAVTGSRIRNVRSDKRHLRARRCGPRDWAMVAEIRG